MKIFIAIFAPDERLPNSATLVPTQIDSKGKCNVHEWPVKLKFDYVFHTRVAKIWDNMLFSYFY